MGKPVVPPAMPRSRRERRRGESGGRRRPKGARRAGALAWARRTFPVNGERRPRASIQSGRETTLGPRVVHYPLRCPSLPPHLEFSSRSARPRPQRSQRSTDLLIPLLRTSLVGPALLYYLLFCHCYCLRYYYMLVITGIRISSCIVPPSDYI